MASTIDICNTALAHLGQDSEVASISPPDGSVEASHCARFYPIARRVLLEASNWSFATVRTSNLAATTSDSTAWAFRYTLPGDCLKVQRVVAPGAIDESKGERFTVEGSVLYTNVETPTLFYTKDVVDTSKYTEMFVDALGYMLASYLAGPILKKVEAGKGYRDIALTVGKQAAASNANASLAQTHEAPASWMAKR